MFAEKKVQVLDVKTLAKGNFIVIANMDYDYDGDGGLFLYEGSQFNGLIKSCYEHELVVVNCEGQSKRIGIGSLYKGDDTDGKHTEYKIIEVSSILLHPAEECEE